MTTQTRQEDPAITAYREKMRQGQIALEKTIAGAGGRRDEVPPAPNPDEVVQLEAERASRPPRELTDEELGLGELGIPERRVRGIGAAWNFTMGPVMVYEGPQTIGKILKVTEPVVLVADYIPEDELKKIERTRVRGYVIEKGSLIDPTYWFYKDENRACVIGAKGALELVCEGDTAVVDGIRGVAYFGPDAGTARDYEYLRWIGPPPEDKLLLEGLRMLAGVLMGTKIRLGEKPPYDFDEQPRLLEIAKKARAGAAITKEDDEWMKKFVLVGLPSPEQLIAEGKKPRDIGAAAREEKKKEEREAKEAEKAEKKQATGNRQQATGRQQPQAAAEDEPKGAAVSKAEVTATAAPADKTETAKVETSKSETATAAAKPAEAEAPKADAKDAAAARKAQREAEMAAAQAARSAKHKKDGEEGKKS